MLAKDEGEDEVVSYPIQRSRLAALHSQVATGACATLAIRAQLPLDATKSLSQGQPTESTRQGRRSRRSRLSPATWPNGRRSSACALSSGQSGSRSPLMSSSRNSFAISSGHDLLLVAVPAATIGSRSSSSGSTRNDGRCRLLSSLLSGDGWSDELATLLLLRTTVPLILTRSSRIRIPRPGRRRRPARTCSGSRRSSLGYGARCTAWSDRYVAAMVRLDDNGEDATVSEDPV